MNMLENRDNNNISINDSAINNNKSFSNIMDPSNKFSPKSHGCVNLTNQFNQYNQQNQQQRHKKIKSEANENEYIR